MAQIMIVEDNQGTNKAICEYLKTAGHTLFPALDGEEALNIFRDNSIDLAVLDIMLPKMSGVTILHEIRKISNIPVVMLTAVDDEYTQSNSFDELADDYITKPFSMLILGKRITALLRRSENKSTVSTIRLGNVTVDFAGLCEPYRLIAETNGLRFQIEIIEDMSVRLPENQLKKALSNILSNAVNYTEAERHIKVKLEKSVLSIQNECVPLSPDELQHIFEPFYRPNRARNPANGGNGLGLYIVKTILDKQGLQYCFTSMKSKTGMEFVIYF